MDCRARRRIALAALAFAGLSAAPASAGGSSAYTRLRLEACRELERAPDAAPTESGQWRCKGYRGVAVLLREQDLRFFVSYGPNAENEPAARTWAAASFYTLGDRIEWRLDRRGRPFATILRLRTQSEDAKGSSLVVTRLGGPGQVCHVAYIDAVARPDANALARRAADETAPGFRCGVDQAERFE